MVMFRLAVGHWMDDPSAATIAMTQQDRVYVQEDVSTERSRLSAMVIPIYKIRGSYKCVPY